MIPVKAATRTTSGTAAWSPLEHSVSGAYLLNVTDATGGAGDTLNVYIQNSVDGGTTWDDYISFTQVKGNDAMPKQFTAQHSSVVTPDSKFHAVSDGALAAGTALQGTIGSERRVKWVISGTGSFTFSVHAAFV